jgi:hypothetical protein
MISTHKAHFGSWPELATMHNLAVNDPLLPSQRVLKCYAKYVSVRFRNRRILALRDA